MTRRDCLLLSAAMAVSLAGGAAGLGGCAAKPRWPEPELAAMSASGEGVMLHVQVGGGPVDVPDLAASDGATLTRSAAIARAVATHPEIQASLARVRLTFAEAHQARLLPNPILRVALRFPESGGDPVIEAGLSAELLSLLQKPGRIKVADARLRGASAEAVARTLDVLAEAQGRYVAVQALDALALVQQERVKLLARLGGIAESRLRAGEGVRLDVTTLRAQEVELELEIAERAMEQREGRLQLARLIDRPSDEAAWALEPRQATPAAEREEKAWILAALEHRPEIQSRMWELAALGVEVRLAQWALLDGGEVGVASERDGRWSVGPEAAVPLPLLDWGQERQNAATARQSEAAHQLTQARRIVVEEVRRALAAHEAARLMAARAGEQWLPLLEQRQREAESAYRAGQSDVVPLILATQDLQTGRARLIELERRTAEAWIRLHRAVGGPGHAPASLASSAAQSTPAVSSASQPASAPATRPSISANP
ncbi:MAG: TolC family protein [Planctomycetota bacterium]|nr:TolC family protein [Planctomycetota bacterium]